MEKEKIKEISNLLEDTFNEHNVNVQLLLFSLLTEEDYDPEFEGLTPFRIVYVAVEDTCALLEQSDSLTKLKNLIIKRKELLNLDRNELYNNTGEKIAEKLSLKPLILEVGDEIEKLETLQRTGLLTTEKKEEINRFETILTDDRRLELCNKIIAESASDKPNYTKTPLICDEKYLMSLYSEYDGVIWESVSFETFRDYMRDEPIGQINPIPMIKDFGMWIRRYIEPKRSKGMAKNINDWYKKLTKTKTKLSDIAPLS